MEIIGWQFGLWYGICLKYHYESEIFLYESTIILTDIIFCMEFSEFESYNGYYKLHPCHCVIKPSFSIVLRIISLHH